RDEDAAGIGLVVDDARLSSKPPHDDGPGRGKTSILPRSISFKGAIQTLEAFQPLINLRTARDGAHRLRLYRRLLDAIRPDRYEPRLKKAEAQALWPADQATCRNQTSTGQGAHGRRN